VWFTETHLIFVISFLLVALFTQFILDKLSTGLLNQVKQTKSHFINLSPSLIFPPSHRSRKQLTSSTDACARCPLLTYFFYLNAFPHNPSYLSPMVPEYMPITGASKPNKRLYKMFGYRRIQKTHSLSCSTARNILCLLIFRH
jgi:hypothetical protein